MATNDCCIYVFICVFQQYSKESINQLVLEVESLVREETCFLKTHMRYGQPDASAMSQTLPNRKKSDKNSLLSNPKIQRVQNWLQHQPTSTISLDTAKPTLLSAGTTDCEASGEYTGMCLFNVFI